MSMFLGPIHYIMFNKIRVAAGRSLAVIETFKKKYPSETEETVKTALPEGVSDFGDTPLEELMGDNPIHQFLQGLIDKVETDEATLVTALLYRFPDDGRELLLEAFRSHGAETAEKALAGNGNERDLNTVVNMLGEHYLEGMPCDQVSSYDSNGENSIEVTQSDCLHMPKWESAGAPVETMCELLDGWVAGFANAVSPGIKMERSAAIVKGADACRCLITSS